MDEEDLEPRAAQPKPRKLETMSIAALYDYVAELEAEIARVKAAIAGKDEALGDAESVFRR